MGILGHMTPRFQSYEISEKTRPTVKSHLNLSVQQMKSNCSFTLSQMASKAWGI